MQNYMLQKAENYFQSTILLKVLHNIDLAFLSSILSTQLSWHCEIKPQLIHSGKTQFQVLHYPNTYNQQASKKCLLLAELTSHWCYRALYHEVQKEINETSAVSFDKSHPTSVLGLTKQERNQRKYLLLIKY